MAVFVRNLISHPTERRERHNDLPILRKAQPSARTLLLHLSLEDSMNPREAWIAVTILTIVLLAALATAGVFKL